VPGIGSFSIGFAKFILTNISVPIDKSFLSSTMFKKVFELALVSTISMFESSLSVLSIIQPLPFIAITLRGSPYTKPTFYTLFPISLEFLTIVPLESSISLSFSVCEISFVYTVYISFTTFYFNIFIINPFKNLFLRNSDTRSNFTLIFILTKIYSFLLFNN
jgi:hypothetical protein